MIEDLEKQIIAAATEYYSGGKCSLTDKEFDDLTDSLKALDPENQLLKTAGWGFKPSAAHKVRHIGANPVGSLPKCKFPEINAAYKRVCYGSGVRAMPKLDGLSTVLYCTPKNFKAVTRGDGKEGIDVSHNINVLIERDYPEFEERFKNSPCNFLAIRGEVIVPKKFEDKVLGIDGVVNTRNFAAGIVNRKEPTEELKYLQFVPYFIRIAEGCGGSGLGDLQWIGDVLGIPLVESMIFRKPNPNMLKSFYEMVSEKYPVDGIVLTPLQWPEELTQDFTFAETLAMAYKFEDEEAEGTISHINWQVGNQGHLTPVAVLEEPVFLSGANIQNITVHNVTQLKAMKLGKGAVIKFVRSNEVIPLITGVVKEADQVIVPTRCPLCESRTQQKGAYLECSSFTCPSRQKAAVFRFLNICGIPHGLGDTMINAWMLHMQIDTLKDLVTIVRDSPSLLVWLQGEFKTKYGKLLFDMEENIQVKLKDGLSYSECWYVCNIPNLGQRMSVRLKDNHPREWPGFDEINSIVRNSAVAQSIVENHDHIFTLTGIFTINEPEIKEEKQQKFQIAMTGKLSVGRSEFESEMQDLGIEVGGISKKTKYLVCDKPSSSSKFQKAEKLNIPIVTEAQFREILNETKIDSTRGS